MQDISEDGFVHLFLTVLVLIGIAVGVFLVQQKTQFFSKAFNLDESIESLTEKLNQLNEPTRSAQESEGGKIGQMIVIAAKRQEKLAALVEEDPKAFIQQATLVKSTNSFPQEVQPYLEQEKELSGTVSIWHTDDFQDNKNSHDQYRLETADKSYNLYMDDMLKNLKVGTFISIKGVAIGTKIAIDSTGNLPAINTSRTSQSATSPVVGEHKVIAMLVKFQNTTSEPVTADEVSNLLFGESNSVKKHFYDFSYGQLNLTGRVEGYFTTPFKNETDVDHPCDNLLDKWLDPVRNQAREQLSKQGDNFDAYQHQLFILAGNPVCRFKGGGGSIGGNPSIALKF